jgi:hypothetical protein
MEDDDSIRPPLVNDSNLKNMRRNYVNFLNERHRAQHGPGPLANSAKTMTMQDAPSERLLYESGRSPTTGQRDGDVVFKVPTVVGRRVRKSSRRVADRLQPSGSVEAAETHLSAT